jgi:hypothetical protein
MTGVVACAGVAGLILGASSAALATDDPGPSHAGPNTAGNHVAVGSHVTEAVYGEFANAPGLDSFRAFTTPTITLAGLGGGNAILSPPGNTIARPSTSSEGVKLLSATYGTSNVYSPVYVINQSSRVIDIARASSRPSAVLTTPWANAKLVYVPLARDAVSVAVKGVPSVTNLTTGQLNGLYGSGTYQQTSGVWTVGDIAPVTAKGTTNPILVTGVSAGAITTYTELDPKLPQDRGSERAFFLGALGLVTVGAWVEGGLAGDDATALTGPGQVIPFSVSSWIAQWNGVVPSTFNPTTANVALININGLNPYTVTGPSPGVASASSLYGSSSTVPSIGIGNFARDDYSVVVKSTFGAGATPVIPSTGLGKLVALDMPGATATLKDYGFMPLNYAGAGTGWQYSLWAN